MTLDELFEILILDGKSLGLQGQLFELVLHMLIFLLKNLGKLRTVLGLFLDDQLLLDLVLELLLDLLNGVANDHVLLFLIQLTLLQLLLELLHSHLHLRLFLLVALHLLHCVVSFLRQSCNLNLDLLEAAGQLLDVSGGLVMLLLEVLVSLSAYHFLDLLLKLINLVVQLAVLLDQFIKALVFVVLTRILEHFLQNALVLGVLVLLFKLSLLLGCTDLICNQMVSYLCKVGLKLL